MEGDGEYDALYKFLYERVYPANINEKDKKRAFHRKASGYKVERGRLFYYHKSSKSWKLRKRKAKNPQCLSCSSYGGSSWTRQDLQQSC
ncbi:hypothetical protein EMCRGX_G023241 [Ephydatia muelleri]